MYKPVVPIAPKPKRPSSFSRTALTVKAREYSAVCEHIATISLVAAAMLFLVLAVVGVNHQDHWTHLPLVLGLFVVAVGLGFTTLYIAQIRSIGVGWVGGILGLVFTACPLLFALLGARLNFRSDTPLLIQLYHVLPSLGKYLLSISCLQLLASNLYFIVHGRTLLAEQLERGIDKNGQLSSNHFIPRCWETCGCPTHVRNRCPNYIDRVRCWNRRLGCLCDHKLASYLFQIILPEVSVTGQGDHLDLNLLASLTSYPEEVRAMKPRSWKERQPYCHNCAIFLEHQAYKYRRMNWIFLPITLLLTLLLFNYYDLFYNWLTVLLDHLAKQMIATGHLPPGLYVDASGLVGSPYEYVLLGALAMVLMSYVVEITDRILLEWMW